MHKKHKKQKKRKKHKKHQKHKDAQAKVQNANKRISDFIPLRCF